MLLLLKRDMQADLNNKLIQLESLEESTDHQERKMGEFATIVNDLVDGYNEHSKDLWWLKDKMADLEDHFKLRVVPETVSPSELIPYIQELL